MIDYHTNSFNSLKKKEYVKYLGVITDSNLTWKYHLEHIKSKIGRSLGIIVSFLNLPC